jgi:hypothetical protein
LFVKLIVNNIKLIVNNTKLIVNNIKLIVTPKTPSISAALEPPKIRKLSISLKNKQKGNSKKYDLLWITQNSP